MSAPSEGVVHRQHQLDNGLLISAEIDPQAVSAACGFFVDTGARDEPSQLMGVSHFLEHMAFKGSGDLTGEAIDKAFDDLGLDHNAWTSAEATAFWIHARPERLLEGFPILATLLRPELRGQDLEDERKVILEEIAMYEDEPFWVLIEGLLERYYAENGLGHRVLGTNTTVGGISREAMSSYHLERYGPNN
ncbi:MAG: pitrilysin family protein, partial [Planctomycetota bacterium]|nr:pitrilysin family protein [Planctomycetota bacterium]